MVEEEEGWGEDSDEESQEAAPADGSKEDKSVRRKAKKQRKIGTKSSQVQVLMMAQELELEDGEVRYVQRS